ncbi:MAG TPA: MlaD family protein [Planctomycetota bacterium]|nr:MlaD family protein [Planctomycetota bacterium]
MKNRRASPVKIGAFVIGGIAILVAALLLLGSGRLFRRTVPFISYFDGSVNGLRAGAPVKFKGVEIGRVDRIRFLQGLTNKDQPIAVLYSLDADKLEPADDGTEEMAERVRISIENGLRLQLEPDSLVTGVLHASLAFLPDTEAKLHGPHEGVIEIPTIPPAIQEIGEALRSIVERVESYPFEQVLDSLRRALDGVASLTSSPKLQEAIVSLDQALKDFDAAAVEVKRQVAPLGIGLQGVVERFGAVGNDLQQSLASARSTFSAVEGFSGEMSRAVGPLTDSLKSAAEHLQTTALTAQSALESMRVLLDPRAPIAVELRSGLREIAEVARSTRALFELLERDPAALLHGKSSKEGTSR